MYHVFNVFILFSSLLFTQNLDYVYLTSKYSYYFHPNLFYLILWLSIGNFAYVSVQLYFQKMLNTYKLLQLINWFYSQVLDDVLTPRINNKYFFLNIPHPWYYHDFIRKIWTMKLLGVHVETSWHCSNGLFSQLHMMLNVPTCGGGYYFNNFKHENMMRLGSPSTFSYFLVLNKCTPRIRSTHSSLKLFW